MSESESSSQANQTTNYTDSRMVLGQDSSYGSTITRDSGNTSTFNTSDSGNTTSTFTTSNSGNTTTNVTTLDNGAIGRAFDSTDKTVKAGFDFGTDALGFSGDTVKGAFKFGTDTVNKSLGFASDAMQQAFSSNEGTAKDAFSFAQKAADRANGSMADAFSSALNFSAKQTQTALDGLNKASSLVDSAYSDAKGRGAMTDYIMMAAIAGALLVAYMATRRSA